MKTLGTLTWCVVDFFMMTLVADVAAAVAVGAAALVGVPKGAAMLLGLVAWLAMFFGLLSSDRQ